MEPADLARWTRFAMKGGIGRCVAICDCVAESAEDLMFLKDDEIVVLLQVPEADGVYLGYCEGVIGKFNGKHVKFLTKLKKPIMAKRSSIASSSIIGKSPTPTTPIPVTPAATPPIPSNASLRSESRTSSRYMSPQDSPINSTFPVSVSASRVPHPSMRSSLARMDSADVPSSNDTNQGSPVSTTFAMNRIHQQQRSNAGSAVAGSGRRMDSVEVPSSRESSVGGGRRGDSVDIPSLRDTNQGSPVITTFSQQHTAVDSSVSTGGRSMDSVDASVANSERGMDSMNQIDRAPSSSNSNTDDQPPPPPHNRQQWNRASMLERQLEIVQKQTEELEQERLPPMNAPQRPPSLDLDTNTSPLRISKKSPPSSNLSHASPVDEGESLSSAIPDSSYSTTTFGQRLSRASSDGEVGIGLSLLQDLVNGMGDSDSGSEYDDKGDDDRNGERDSSGRSDDDGTVEGLMYGDDDDDDDGGEAAEDENDDTTNIPTSPSTLIQSLDFPMPPVSPTSSFRFRGSEAQSERERRPSLAASLAPSVRSGSSWEGASDIYDNYRYSRFSVMSKAASSHRSSHGPSGVRPPIPEQSVVGEERRKRVDSDASVYTQGSGAGVGNASPTSPSMSMSPPQSPRSPPQNTVFTNAAAAAGGQRPAPLALVQETSPLLHATWGSPMSSPDTASLSFNTPMVPGVVSMGMGVVVPAGGTFGRGAASAMRERIEVMGRGGAGSNGVWEGEDMEEHVDDSIVSGLGNGIVVEEDEEEDQLPPPSATSSHFRMLSGMDREAAVDARALVRGVDEEDGGEGRTPSPGQRRMFGEDEEGEEGDRTLEGIDGSVDARKSSSNGPSLDDHQRDSTNENDIDHHTPIAILPSTPISAAAPPLPPSGPDLSTSPQPSHLRPSLRELREGGTVQVPGTGERRSLFLPHPNAPKAPLTSPGPMYVQQQQPPPPPPSQQQRFHPQHGYGPPPQQQYSQQQQPYGHPQQQQQQHPPYLLNRPRLSFVHVIHQALSTPPPPPRPIIAGRAPLPPRGPTIYGRLEVDLGASMGPVPVVWSLEPPPTKVIRAGPVGGVGAGGVASGGVSTPQVVVGGVGPAPPGPAPGPVPGPVKRPSMLGLREGSTSSEVNIDASGAVGGTTALAAVPAVGSGAEGKSIAPAAAAPAAGDSSTPIPRANFFPKTPGLRPRSRSFSDLKSVQGPTRSSLRSSLSGGEIKKSSSLTGSSALSTTATSPPSVSSPLTSSSTSSTSSSPPTPGTTAKPVKSSPLRPSPLSLSQNIVTNQLLKPKISTPVLKAPTSPLAQSTVIAPPHPVSASVPSSPVTSTSNLAFSGNALNPRRFASRSTLGESRSSVSSESNEGGGVPSASGSERPVPVSRSTLPTSKADVSTSSGGSGLSVLTMPMRSMSGPGGVSGWMGDDPVAPSNKATPANASTPLSTSTSNANANANANAASDARAQLVVSPVSPGGSVGGHGGAPIVRQTSLRAKLSLPNLRRNRIKQDEPPASPMMDEVMLQVQDMEFELVRPNFGQYLAAARTSEDSAILGRDGPGGLDGLGSVSGAGGNGNAGGGGGLNGSTYLRAESPAISISSGNRSPTVEGHTSWMTSSNFSASSPISTASRPVVESETQMEAHRNRESKWMSLLSTSPPSQARKSKKVRKLLLDGVPSSVRYMVWSHLTDGKARSVPGVYAQLGKRGRVPLSDDIERDVEKGWFEEEEQVKLKGGVVQLMQAYLNMVPDIQYMPGLPLIVGQLLLLAPEEDAFWIFISIMDTHIRPYFSAGSTQMEVDSALFSRALEVNDAAVAKKLLVDMGISPGAICGPWFSSLYVGCLPPEFLIRTWDLFLYDGIPFLIRIGLAIVSFVRRQLLECTSEEFALSLLHRPPALSLPPTPENYLSFVLSIKLKDDDVRKQRIKMEAQVKRQTQQQQLRPPTAVGGSISLPRA